MEVNAGQFATFQCTANGKFTTSDRLWLQVIYLLPNAVRSGGTGILLSVRTVKCMKNDRAIYLINLNCVVPLN